MSGTLLRKLVRLSLAEWGELLVAQRALIWAQLLVWTRPTGRLVSRADAAGDSLPAEPLDPRAYRLALAVGRAAEHGLFRPLCLVRAVALHRLLEARQIRGSRIRIGVRQAGGRFLAHAWVEHGAVVLGDVESHTRRFTQLADVHLMDAK
ncbi:MAG TPA: lasso peptide biosynthesis B2 protein [Gemmatimonadaceae bacterium]|nr:lasso peptide biosynthesis B2 protein [Gemmatimonadaceae bacterium]